MAERGVEDQVLLRPRRDAVEVPVRDRDVSLLPEAHLRHRRRRWFGSRIGASLTGRRRHRPAATCVVARRTGIVVTARRAAADAVSSMRIVVDISPLSISRTGIGNYLQGMIAGLADAATRGGHESSPSLRPVCGALAASARVWRGCPSTSGS